MLHLSPALTAYLLFLTALLGVVMGSFCHAWAWRIVHGDSIARGRSRCPQCGHTLAWYDLLPLVSYLLLRGRCRYCAAPIPRRYFAAEAVCGAWFLTILWRYDVSLEALRLWGLGCLLLVLSLVDGDTWELPDGLVAAAGALAALRIPAEGLGAIRSGAMGLMVPAALLAVVLGMDRILKKETMGGGDIKLLSALGLHFGFAGTLLLLIFACGAGLAAGAKRKGEPFPFGPSIALAAWLTAVAGEPILQWYFGLFGL